MLKIVMPLAERPYAPSGRSQFFFPVAVKWLLISNFTIFVINFLARAYGGEWIFYPFGLVPEMVVYKGAIWQLVSYMFLHSTLGFMHILFNMLTLWSFGTDIEYAWGTRKFLKYYFVCGVGAGITVIVAHWIGGDMASRTIGASGAIYGLILAFAMIDPERMVMYSFIFPMKAKYMAMLLGGMAFLMTIGDTGGGISHFAHLGGMLWGYLYLKMNQARKPVRYSKEAGLIEKLQRGYHDWKMERAKRKFQVYMSKNRDKGPWTN